MARPTQSRKSISSPDHRYRRRFLATLGWLIFILLTAVSVGYSVRIWLVLVADNVSTSAKLRTSSKTVSATLAQKRAVPKKKPAFVQRKEEEGSYALVYPNGDCAGAPLRIDYSSKEKNCEHCRDFCDMRFPGRNTTLNLMRWKSVFVFGDHPIEVLASCVGQFDYKEFNKLVSVYPADGCVNIEHSASHARFQTR